MDTGEMRKSGRNTGNTTLYAGAQSFNSAYFGEGCGSIALDDLNCNGFEQRPQDCARVPKSNFRNCGHHKDAGVRCALTGMCNVSMTEYGRHCFVSFSSFLRH